MTISGRVERCDVGAETLTVNGVEWTSPRWFISESPVPFADVVTFCAAGPANCRLFDVREDTIAGTGQGDAERAELWAA